MLTLLGRDEPEGIDLADLVALSHERHDEEPADDHDEGHQTVGPAHTHGGDPGRDVEGHREAEGDAGRVEHDGRLLDVVGEALGQVVDRDGRDAHGRVDDQHGGDGQQAPRRVVLQGAAEQADADAVAPERGQPQRVQAVLGLPVAAVEARGNPQWPYTKASARPTQCENWTTEKGKGQQSTGAACRGKPGRLRGTERVLEGREVVATGGDGLLQTHGRERVHGDREAEAEQREDAEHQADGRRGDLEGDEGNAGQLADRLAGGDAGARQEGGDAVGDEARGQRGVGRARAAVPGGVLDQQEDEEGRDAGDDGEKPGGLLQVASALHDEGT